MKLKKEFIVHNSNGETVLVPTGNANFSGVVKGNKTLGAILELLKEDTTESTIEEEMTKQFDASKEMIERDLKKVLDTLRQIGALEE